ncbi:MAG: MFS transporter [Pseudomonadota bacterium]
MSDSSKTADGAVRAERDAPAGQFGLLRERRFAGLFWTQFLGAFNDNLFKSAITLVFVFSGLVAADQTDIVVNLAAGLFILPFFLFSTLSGQLADKYEKSMLVRRIKIAEILVAVFAVAAVLSESVQLMLIVLFLLGAQSTFFGPLKFSILPQQLKATELVGGNAMIEMGTFVSILLGTVVGGIVASAEQVSLLLSIGVVGVALAGYFTSRSIPETPATAPTLAVDWNPLRQLKALFVLARRDRSVLLSVLGISWFWLLGAGFLAQIPNLAKLHLSGSESVVTLILSVFTIAIALGSLACEKLSGDRVEIGLVPIGAAVLSLAGIDLYFAISAFDASETRNWLGFLAADGSFRVLFDLLLIGVAGGLFIVPLYALIQSRTPAESRARIIAFNNISNAVFMVGVALLAAVLLGGAGMTIPDFLLMLTLMNVAVAWFIFYQVPEFAMRFLVWVLSHTMYRVTHEDLHKIPAEGGALIVCNHVTYVDALLLAGAVKRPIRFIMLKSIYDLPVLNFVFRTCRTIPITGRSKDAAAYEQAFAEIREGLAAGDLLCIFPEGALTKDGEIAAFRTGVERILEETPVPVVPMALKGLWQSFFSHYQGAFNLFKGPKRIWSRVTVTAGEPVEPRVATAEYLERAVNDLRGAHA